MSRWLPLPALAVVLIPVAGGLGHDPTRVERRLHLNHQALSSLEVDDQRKMIVAVNVHADVGVIDDPTTATRVRKTFVAEAQSAAFSADAKLVYVASSDGRVTILETTTLKQKAVVRTGIEHTVRVLIRGRLLALLDVEDTCHVFVIGDVETIRPTLAIKKVVAISNDRDKSSPLRLLTASGVFHSYSPDSLELQCVPSRTVRSSVGQDRIGPDQYLYSQAGKSFARISLTKPDAKWEPFDWPLKGSVHFDFLDQGKLIVADHAGIGIADVSSGKTLAKAPFHDGHPVLVRALADRGSFVVGLLDGTILVGSLAIPK
jgi:hypothetical protein